jgi:twinkle protein
MGQCLAKLPHSCGSNKGLQVFADEDGTVNGYCFSCDTFVSNPYGEVRYAKDLPPVKPGKTEEEVAEQLNEIAECGVCDLVDRRLRGDSLDYFNIKIGLDTKDGKTPKIAFLPYTKDGEVVKCKARLLEEKRMWHIGSEKEVDLFGWEQAKASGAKRLIITEGEFDAVALRKILEMHTKPEFKDYMPAVASLINGSKSAGKDLARLAPKIKKHFQEVSFCFDDDKSGHDAVIAACKVMPHGTSITLPSNDANACILEGTTRGAFNAATFRAEKPKNTSIVWLDDVWDSAKEQAEHGVSWPWANITEQTRGIRKGETIYIGAGPKIGKSEVVNAIAAHLVGVHNWKILMAKPEEANKKTVKLLAGKIASARFHDPNVEFDESAYDLGWDTLKQDIVAAAAAGVDAVFIDPITNLTNGMEAGAANIKLQEVAQEISAMALDLDIVVFLFCHLRNPDGGPEHNRGGVVLSSQFAGSRAMARSCNYMFGLEGNKDPELDEDERNIRSLVLLEDREFGEVGKTDLFWSKKTTQFTQL